MTSTEEPIQNQPAAGELLRQFREKKNLSVQEVASQLRLDPGIIEALENDDYERFPADTYIRGYLRNYAKLIGIDGDEIISLYESEAPEPPEIIPDVKHSTQVSSSDKPVKAFTYLVTFILVLLLLIWWWQSNYVFNSGIRLTPFLNNSTGVTQPENKQDKATVTQPAEIPATGTDSEQAVPPLQPEPEPEPNQSEPAEPATNTAPESSAATATTTAPAELENTQTATSTSPAEDKTEERAMPGPDTLYFKLNADCWIEVHDRFDKEVYVNLARKGDEVYLNGFAPFKVKLGNAQGVVIEFNNKPFDPAPYTTRGIARFTLGEQ